VASRPRVLIIVVNWNGERYLGNCIEAAMGSSYGNLGLLVVDNASSDGSLHLVARYPSVGLIRLHENRGWGGGINAGLASEMAQQADFYLCMNNDVNLDRNAVEALVSCAEQHPDFGIFSPILTDIDGRAAYAGGFFTQLGWWRRHWFDDHVEGDLTELDVVIGAAMLVRKEVVGRIGGLDPEFFLYREDVDYCRRARDSGFRIGAVHEARAVHVIGGSTTKNRGDGPSWSMPSLDTDGIYAVSSVKYAFKHLTTPELLRWLLTRRGRSSWRLVLQLWPRLILIRRRRRCKVPVTT
jgi:GT2 family glycosyltransferase